MSMYCQPSDLTTYAINPIALTGVSPGEQTGACIAASEKADSYMRGRYALPLLAWGQDIVIHTAYIAVYLLMTSRGYNPSAGADDLIRLRYEDAVHWFEGIQRQSVHPDVTPAVAQPGDPVHDLPQVITSPQRGWTQTGGRGWPVI